MYRINYIDANGFLRHCITESTYLGEEVNRLVLDEGLVVVTVTQEV